MKTNFTFSLIYLFMIMLFAGPGQSQTDDNGAPYFPLRVGNAFYYRYYHCNPGGCDSAFIVSRITQTKVFNGRRYYYCSNIFGRTNQNYYVRYNATTGNLVYLDTTNSGCNYEIALYKLSANAGDSVSTSCRETNYKCYSIVDSAIFDLSTRVKKYSFYHTTNGWVTERGTYFARRIGSIYDYSATYNNSFASFQRLMQGCKINGNVYGDTIDHITPAYTDSGRYMPLAIGNKWVYYCTHEPPITNHIEVAQITKDTVINNKKYFYLTGFPADSNPFWIRYDAATGKLIRYIDSPGCNNEYNLFNLAALKGDTVNNAYGCQMYNYTCLGVNDISIFDIRSKEKRYHYSYSGHYETFNDYRFIKNIGFSLFEGGYSGNIYDHLIKNLKGCVINGIVYGDTTSIIPPDYSDSARYFPLKIGNNYYYKMKRTSHWSHPHPDSTVVDSGYFISRITDTARYYGYLYYKMNTFIDYTPIHYFRYQADSGFITSYNVMECYFETKCYKLASVLNELGYGWCELHNMAQQCIALHDTTAFGTQRKLKRFKISYGGTTFHILETQFVKDIGLSQYIDSYYDPLPAYSTTLRYDLIGAFVNGVKYGDTNTVGIKNIGSSVPDKFELYQNYPNPFNPVTVIKYSIPVLSSPHAQELSSPHALGGDLVLLKVYDILGREIQTLVNEKQSPGTYEVTFDGSKLASGIYFYTLNTGDFKETKKLVLLK